MKIITFRVSVLKIDFIVAFHRAVEDKRKPMKKNHKNTGLIYKSLLNLRAI